MTDLQIGAEKYVMSMPRLTAYRVGVSSLLCEAPLQGALPGTKIHIVYTLDGCALLHYN